MSVKITDMKVGQKYISNLGTIWEIIGIGKEKVFCKGLIDEVLYNQSQVDAYEWRLIVPKIKFYAFCFKRVYQSEWSSISSVHKFNVEQSRENIIRDGGTATLIMEFEIDESQTGNTSS